LNRSIFIVALLLFGGELFSQKILLVENVHSLKNFKYYQGNMIMFKLAGGHSRISDNICDLTDTTVIFEGLGEVKIANISSIYRENWLIETLSGLSILGGVAYFGLDSFNRMINHEYPVCQTETMLISGGMVAFGLALIPLRYRKINISEKWRFKCIDPDSY
jgi:uncharacterized membrane protein SirB2